MSFKDIRDLSEHLKLLGYHKHFPLTALYTNYGGLSSFKVVADILQWLAGRLEPGRLESGAVLPGGTSTEADRILLIRSATEFFVTKSGIKVNPRKLYTSSSAAAKELQKITSLLMMTPSENDNEDDESYKSIAQVDLGDKIDDLRRTRELSSVLTNRGAALYELLSKELLNKETRILQSSRPLEISSVERSLKNSIASAQLKLQSSKGQLENSRIEKNALSSKLQRKKAELERSTQRLEALQKIRPAYLEEFEQLEEELRDLFQQYFLHIHCRDALKAQLLARTKVTTPISSPLINPTENSILIPEGLIDDEDDEDIDDDDEEDSIGANFPSLQNEEKHIERRDSSRIRPTTGRFKPKTGASIGKTTTIGNMLGDGDHMLDSSLGSGSDSEIDLGENGIYDLNSEDDISISKLTRNVPTKSVKKNDHSDEDF